MLGRWSRGKEIVPTSHYFTFYTTSVRLLYPRVYIKGELQKAHVGAKRINKDTARKEKAANSTLLFIYFRALCFESNQWL